MDRQYRSVDLIINATFSWRIQVQHDDKCHDQCDPTTPLSLVLCWTDQLLKRQIKPQAPASISTPHKPFESACKPLQALRSTPHMRPESVATIQTPRRARQLHLATPANSHKHLRRSPAFARSGLSRRSMPRNSGKRKTRPPVCGNPTLARRLTS